MRGAPGNWVGAELALARRKRAQTATTRGPPPAPWPPGDPRTGSPLDPRQSAGDSLYTKGGRERARRHNFLHLREHWAEWGALEERLRNRMMKMTEEDEEGN
ncbi:hypothetical protein Cadr_000017809 [Camelus dromedarius]|uniref:Uncharacterized protein n=1 Tax=Camelus dromedarius TaxID=9838 RepID=A0A5N4D727_CAMDR|nr:hypothetical protein Cadr_000017809 [Camelus dromedarius]